MEKWAIQPQPFSVVCFVIIIIVIIINIIIIDISILAVLHTSRSPVLVKKKRGIWASDHNQTPRREITLM